MAASASQKPASARPARGQLKEYAIATCSVAFLTVASRLLTFHIGYPAIALIFLLGVVLVGMVLRRGPVLLAAGLSALSWNFLFIPPLFTLHIAKLQDALMFATYFVVAIAIGSLTSRLRAREQLERDREQRATAQYLFAQRLAVASSLDDALRAATEHIRELLGLNATVALDAQKPVGTPTVFPIAGLTNHLGELRVEPAPGSTLGSSESQLLQAFAEQLASVIERERLKQLAAQAQLSVEAERLRKALFDCVSHELKTPIAAIRAASQQLEQHPELSRQLAREIQHGSRRLHRVVNNLLDMTRLESGLMQTKLEWCDVGELLRSVIEAEEEALRGREIRVSAAENLPLALLDYSLIEQAIAKLLGNAASYTPAGIPIEIAAQLTDDRLLISVSDTGPGLPAEPERVFEKFYRGNACQTGGLGLGLSIARGFIEAHGGKLTAANRNTGGACFSIELPVALAERTVLEATA